MPDERSVEQFPPLLGVSETRIKILESFSPLTPELVPLAKVDGRVLTDSIIAPYDLPPFSNSAMDGFAVQVDDLKGATSSQPVKLNVVADIPAGQIVEFALRAGQAARIMTGAVVPAETGAVVPVEDTDFNYRQAGLSAPENVKVYRPVQDGENIRRSGEDVRRGEIVMDAGTRLHPQHIGFLSMLGVASVSVHSIPRVAILSSGDELLPVGVPLTYGKIYDANGTTLAALVKKYGGEPVTLGIVPDEKDAVIARLGRAVASEVNLIISSAGVSVGAFDYVRSVIEQDGRLDFWRVNMRPGKPIAFGEYRGVPFFGLPGNPVSAFVGFEVFVRSALLKLVGVLDWKHTARRARLLEPIESDGRESYLRAIVDQQNDGLMVRLTGHQGSGNLRSLVQANALLVLPAGVKNKRAGDEVECWLFDE